MNRSIFFTVTILLCSWTVGYSQSASLESWADAASSEYSIVSNITYATASNTELKLDLYLPRNRTVPVPTLIHFHGGGWVAGQKETNIFQLLPYLAMGWAVINVEYRLARIAPAPAAVEDCRCALQWVGNHAKEYNFDITKIVLTGGSAGGHLALITGMLPSNTIFDRQCPTNDSIRWTSGREPQVNIAAIVNWYGISDVAELIDGPNAKHYAIEWFGSMDGRKDLARQLSPISYIRFDTPPIISIHGDQDNIVPYSQSVRLHDGLEKAGVSNKLVTIKGAKHGGFSKKAMVESFVTIREFLRKNKILMDR